MNPQPDFGGWIDTFLVISFLLIISVPILWAVSSKQEK